MRADSANTPVMTNIGGVVGTSLSSNGSVILVETPFRFNDDGVFPVYIKNTNGRLVNIFDDGELVFRYHAYLQLKEINERKKIKEILINIAKKYNIQYTQGIFETMTNIDSVQTSLIQFLGFLSELKSKENTIFSTEI